MCCTLSASCWTSDMLDQTSRPESENRMCCKLSAIPFCSCHLGQADSKQPDNTCHRHRLPDQHTGYRHGQLQRRISSSKHTQAYWQSIESAVSTSTTQTSRNTINSSTHEADRRQASIFLAQKHPSILSLWQKYQCLNMTLQQTKCT